MGGASRGIGLAFVQRLAAGGRARRIRAGCRAPAEAHELRDLARAHPGVRVLPLDVTREASLGAAAEQVAAEGERIPW